MPSEIWPCEMSLELISIVNGLTSGPLDSIELANDAQVCPCAA